MIMVNSDSHLYKVPSTSEAPTVDLISSEIPEELIETVGDVTRDKDLVGVGQSIAH